MTQQGCGESRLKLNNVSLAFVDNDGYQLAVDEICLSLNSGETAVIIGESGCGKSLTSHAIINLLPSNALFSSQSEIYYQQQDLLEQTELEWRNSRGSKIAMIFQEPMTALNPVLTIGEQIGEAIKQHCKIDSAKQLRQKVITLLEEVEMPNASERIDDYPHQFSGGQKQRVVIAMAIACEPQVLIADEPTTALDVTVQQQILNLLKRLQQKHGMALLFITHDLGVAKAIADKIYVMYCGQLVESAPVDEFFSGVKHPYSQQLLAALPDKDKTGQFLYAIKGSVPGLSNWPSGCRFHPRCAHRMDKCANQAPAYIEKDNGAVRCFLADKSLPPLSLPVKAHAETVTSQTILQVEKLSVTFCGKKRLLGSNRSSVVAVDNVSFAVKSGETLAIVGESGCGKTTLSRAILQLIASESDEIKFAGKSIKQLTKQGLKQLRKDCQIIFQDPFSSMNPRMTVYDIIAEGIKAHFTQLSRNDIEQQVIALLKQVGLNSDACYRYPHQFSGGQRQRISIARALAVKPKLIICDEPTSALDVSVQAQLLNLLKSLQQQYQLAYLFISHDMSVISYMADNILVMKEGKIVEQGSAKTILAQPKHPYTQQLLNSVYHV